MLPFGRMLQYGNTVSALKEAKKVVATQSSWFVLDKDSNLYVRGLNVFYNFGIPSMSNTNFIDDYTISRTNVRNVWAAQNRQASVIQLNDGTIHFSGSQAILNGDAYSNQFITQYTQQTGIPTSNVKNVIFSSYCLALLYENGDVWMSGNKRNVTGVSGSSGWAKHMSNILQLQDCNTNWMALETSGNIYGSGQNISNILNSTASSSTFYPYPVLVGTVGVPAGVKLFGEQYCVKAGAIPGNGIYGKGYGGMYAFGDGLTSGYTTFTKISTPWPNSSTAIGINVPSNVVLQRTFYYTPSALYVFGAGGAGIGGLPDTGWITTPKAVTNLPFNPSVIKFIYRAANIGTIISTGEDWYYSGIYSTGASSIGTIAEFQKVNDMLFKGFDLSKIEEISFY